MVARAPPTLTVPTATTVIDAVDVEDVESMATEGVANGNRRIKGAARAQLRLRPRRKVRSRHYRQAHRPLLLRRLRPP